MLLHRRERLLHDGALNGIGAGMDVKRQPASHHLVQYHPQREEIALGSSVAQALNLFGRHVADRACRGIGGGDVRIGGLHLGQAKIPDLHLSVVGQQDVAGLQVAMEDGPLVRLPDGLHDLRKHLQRPRKRQRVRLVQDRAQGAALHILHHQKHPMGRFTKRQHPHDGGAIQLSQRPRLRSEAFAKGAVGRLIRVDDLDGHDLVERFIHRPVDRPHAPATQLFYEAVAFDRFADQRLHQGAGER